MCVSTKGTTKILNSHLYSIQEIDYGYLQETNIFLDVLDSIESDFTL